MKGGLNMTSAMLEDVQFEAIQDSYAQNDNLTSYSPNWSLHADD